jgi:ketosteroid isomerase-like protein
MKIKYLLPVMLCITALFFAACTTAPAETKPVDMEKLKADIQKMEDAYAAGEKVRDVNAVAAYYADDATSYPRERAPQVGIAAIKEGIAKGFAEDSTKNYNVYKVVDLFTEGNMVVEIGSWDRKDSAGAAIGNGHYMSYFQNRNGKYVCVRDMSVSSNPAKAPLKP